MLVNFGDNTVYAIAHQIQVAATQDHVMQLEAGAGLPGIAGMAIDLREIWVYGVLSGAPSFGTMNVAIYDDAAGAPTNQVANTLGAMPGLPVDPVAPAWGRWILPTPYPQLVAGQPYWLGVGAAGAPNAFVNIYRLGNPANSYETRAGVGGPFPLDPWGVYAASGSDNFSAYIVVDIPAAVNPINGEHAPEKYHRLMGHRGGLR